MSTLKVGAVRGVSASSDAITVANDGSCTANITNRPNRNILINGDMRICQRSTSTTSINAYIVDRWRSFGGPLGLTISQVSDATNYPQSQFALRLHRTAGNSQTNNVGLGQGVETLNSKPYAGKTIVLSFKARRGANFSSGSNLLTVGINGGEGTDENPFGMTNTNGASTTVTLTESVQRFNLTFDVPTDKTQLTVLFSYTPSGTAGANDWFEITECQLEEGSIPSDFEFRSFSQELTLCQRYYQQIAGKTDNVLIGAGRSSGSSTGIFSIPLAVPLRATPTVNSIDWAFFTATNQTNLTATPTVEKWDAVSPVLTCYVSGLSSMTNARCLSAYSNSANTFTISAEL